jgi:hypothetical protein
MKIKTLKIKIESDNQTFEVSDFFEGSNTLYDKFAQIVEEPDGKYWHVIIFYKNDSPGFAKSKPVDIELPPEFLEEINEFIKTNPPIYKRASNCIKGNIDKLFGIEKFTDFRRFRNLGEESLIKDTIFFSSILEIIEKHRK